MRTGTKLASFAAAVAVAFGGAAAVGAAFGPIDVGDNESHSTHAPDDIAASRVPRGLAVAEAGYRLAVDATTLEAGEPALFGFAIVDEDGHPVTAFDELHERPLHLIVLSRNMVDYLHLHSTMDPTGHWTVELPALDPGSYRVFADFQPTGAANLTLGTDITVAGNVRSVPIPPPSNIAGVGGYTVTMDSTPTLGDSELSFTVEVDGRIVRTDPYLGAAGHLVAIRTGDLAYLHVHPHEDDSSAEITFDAEFPTAGTYRLFFEFSHGDTVRTAAYTVAVGLDTTNTTATMTTHGEGH